MPGHEARRKSEEPQMRSERKHEAATTGSAAIPDKGSGALGYIRAPGVTQRTPRTVPMHISQFAIPGRTHRKSKRVKSLVKLLQVFGPVEVVCGDEGPSFPGLFFLTPSHLVSALWGSKRVCLSTRELLKPAISREFLSQQLQGGFAAPISGKNKGPLRGPF